MKREINETVDLLHLIAKLKFFAPYKTMLISMIIAGAAIGYLYFILLSPFKVDIEYYAQDFKLVNPIFDSSIQTSATYISRIGKLKPRRNEEGKIDLFIISGEDNTAEGAKKQAIKESEDLFNESIRIYVRLLIDSFIKSEKSILFSSAAEEISIERSLRKSIQKLDRLLSARKQILVNEVVVSDSNKNDSSTSIKEFYLNPEKMRNLDSEIMATKVEIEVAKLTLKKFKVITFADDSLLKFSELSDSALMKFSINGEALVEKTLRLIDETEKSDGINENSIERLNNFKISIKNYVLAMKLIHSNEVIKSAESKYKLIYCILGGSIFTLLINISFILLRKKFNLKFSEHIQRFRN